MGGLGAARSPAGQAPGAQDPAHQQGAELRGEQALRPECAIERSKWDGHQGGEGDREKGVRADDIELLCNDKMLTPDMTLSKVRHGIWKRSDDIIIQFRERG